MLETAEDEGVVEPSEAELVEEALEFGDIQVRSVMVPRVDVTSIEADTSIGDAMRISSKPAFRACPSIGILPTAFSASCISRMSFA